jgi:hypothetical protein
MQYKLYQPVIYQEHALMPLLFVGEVFDVVSIDIVSDLTDDETLAK